MGKNILFTSVGNLALPTAAECLKKTYPDCKVVGTDVRDTAHGLYFCDKRYLVSRRDNPKFIDDVFKIIKNENINIIFPLSTEDQDFFSKRKEIFEKMGIKTVCSDYGAVRIINNKYKLYNALKGCGIAYPEFYKISDFPSLEKIISKHGFSDKPFVIKPFVGKGGQNLYIVSKDKTLLRQDDLKFFKEYNDFWSNINEYVRPRKTLISEYLNGDEYSVDTLSSAGKFYYGVVRKRYLTSGGLALEAEVVKNDAVLKLAKLLVEKFCLSFINNIQIKEDDQDILKIMEVNPRIPGTLNLSIKAGPDFISDSMKVLDGLEVSPPSLRYGMKILRYWTGVFIEREDYNSIIDLR